MFKRIMIGAAVMFGGVTATAATVYAVMPREWLETLAIAAGTCFYHFAMRLLVGAAWIPFQHHDPHRWWFRQKRFEPKIYTFLRVKTWKAHAPTYEPDTFDVSKHSLEEIIEAMCHSELVHETIAVLSFMPLLAAIPFGEFPVFLITSVLAALYDLSFVTIQRYNRPRLLRILHRKR